MTVTAALVREQRTEFAVVLVTANSSQPGSRDQVQRGFAPLFPGVPIVLCSQDSRGIPSYYGRRDIVQFLSSVLLEQLPWREYHLS